MPPNPPTSAGLAVRLAVTSGDDPPQQDAMESRQPSGWDCSVRLAALVRSYRVDVDGVDDLRVAG